MKVLVFGASGQLGQCLKSVCKEQGFDDISFLEERSADILNKDGLAAIFAREMPSHVINCAAYTAVDKAEDDVEQARAVNRSGVENLAALCRSNNSTLIHISTDFVFEGNVPHLLTESDVAKPINIYGITKLEGEMSLSAMIHKFFIIRTSWLYSEYGNNFVKTMLRLGRERDQLSVVADQVGSPTYAIDLAAAVLDIIRSESEDYGIYHYSNEGLCSWYDFAKAIFDISGIDVHVKPVKTSEYITKAVRPAFSVMDKSKIKNTFGFDIPYWRASLETCLSRIGQQAVV